MLNLLFIFQIGVRLLSDSFQTDGLEKIIKTSDFRLVQIGSDWFRLVQIGFRMSRIFVELFRLRKCPENADQFSIIFLNILNIFE